MTTTGLTATSRRHGALVAAALLAAVHGSATRPAGACSMFSLTIDEHAYLAANEDFTEPGVIWFVPARKTHHGRVNLGFADRFVQTSMNDEGLAFDAAVVAEVPYEPDPEKKTPDNLVDRIMDECATVEQAIAYFRRYNCPHLSRTQFMFADRTGASAVIGWFPGKGLTVTRGDGPYQLVTNSRPAASSYRCPRHVLAQRLLRDPAAYDLDLVRDALDTMHQRGPQAFTTYSVVYDLTAGTVTVYNLADFGRSKTWVLADALQRGKHAHELADVFEAPGALEAIRAAEPRRYDTEIPLAPDELRRFAGTYRIEGAEAALRIELRNGALVLLPPDGSEAHLYPEEPTLFRLRGGGQIRFDVAEGGPVRGLMLYRFGDHRAVRVD